MRRDKSKARTVRNALVNVWVENTHALALDWKKKTKQTSGEPGAQNTEKGERGEKKQRTKDGIRFSCFPCSRGARPLVIKKNLFYQIKYHFKLGPTFDFLPCFLT